MAVEMKSDYQETPVAKMIGQVLKRQITACDKARERFLKSGYEIMRYGFSPEYKFEYQATNPRAWFMAKYGKTSEAMQVIVPSLVQTTPFRLLTPRDGATPQARMRAQVMQNYLNYTTSITGHAAYSRRGAEEGVGYGRGVRWTGRDPRTGMIVSMWDTVRNLGIDANARLWDDAMLIYRCREMPKYEAIKLWPKARKCIMSLETCAMRASDTYMTYSWEAKDTSADCVRLYVFYLLVGVQNLKGGSEIVKEAARSGGQMTNDDDVEAMSFTEDNTPLMYVISESGKLISVGPWDIPFHEMPHDRFPVSCLDFYNNPDSIWPVSPLEPGIGFQRAMNHVVTLLMGKYRYTSKTVLAMKKQNRNGLSPKDKDKVVPRLSQQDIEVIEVEMSGSENQTLKNFIESFDYSNEYISYGLQLLEAWERRFERLTGLTEFLATGISPTQDRTAKGAEIKDRNSRTRIEDMRDRVAEHESTLARKEAFAARYLLKGEDVAPLLGEEAGKAWGFLAPPEMMQPDYWINYFMQGGVDPQNAQMLAQEKVANAVSMETFPYEIDYGIESASIRRKDIDRQLDILKELNNQNSTIQLQSGDPLEKAAAYDQFATYFKLAGLPDELVAGQKALANYFRSMVPIDPNTGLPLPPQPQGPPPPPGPPA